MEEESSSDIDVAFCYLSSIVTRKHHQYVCQMLVSLIGIEFKKKKNSIYVYVFLNQAKKKKQSFVLIDQFGCLDLDLFIISS